MFGLGFWEIVVIVLLLLMVVGPNRIGPLARAVGRAMREVRKGVDEFRESFGIDERIRDIEAVKSEIVETIEADAEEVEVIKSEPTAPADKDSGNG